MDGLYNRVARRRRRGQSGFTLIELLVVIAVLAILATIVIFNVTGVVNRGTTAACVTDLKTVQTASDAYYSDNSKYPTAGGGAGDSQFRPTWIAPYRRKPRHTCTATPTSPGTSINRLRNGNSATPVAGPSFVSYMLVTLLPKQDAAVNDSTATDTRPTKASRSSNCSWSSRCWPSGFSASSATRITP